MNKKVLIISASFRKGGNSDTLCDQLANGARETGHTVEKIFLRDKTVKYCTGCYVCERTNGVCAIKDDMPEILEKIIQADDPPKLKYITRSELKRIMEIPMHSRMLELVRRMFIFSSFSGLAYVDMQRLYPRHIGKTAQGRLYIRKKREKTNVEAFIPLHPIAQQILSLYNTEDDTKPIFPLPENRDVIWNDINQIGVVAGLKESLSYHAARHNDYPFLVKISKLQDLFCR